MAKIRNAPPSGPLTHAEVCARAGRAAQAKLTPEQRSQRSRELVQARWEKWRKKRAAQEAAA